MSASLTIASAVPCWPRAVAAFERAFGSLEGRRWFGHFVPGRIEVLGKHTDYAGGRSLLAATACGVVVVAARNGSGEIRLVNADPQFPPATFPWTADLDVPIGPWTNYPMTAARRLARNFGRETKLEGVDIAFASDLPPASGMSSSSAMLVASYFALARANRLSDLARHQQNIRCTEDLATYLACIENGRSFRELDGDRGVGTFGGSEDHTAMLCCQDGTLSVYSFCPTRFERHVPFPTDLVFVICHSGVFAQKTGEALEKYNAVSDRARRACAAYNARYGTSHQTLADIVRESGTAALERLAGLPGANDGPDRLLDRFRQFVVESDQIIPRAAEALVRRELAAFGELVDQSHAASRDLLGNIIPEIDHLQSSARRLGAVASSGFGAGFGGSAYAMVPAARAEEFQRDWERVYLERFPAHRGRAMWLMTRPSAGARPLD